ncbi:MAG: PSD1 and planctomycete cytochrome C domain-containing protein [Verrucomicrobiota bacterium]|nr:PSD1 and planctomycete cytochrome C domain-containing protein [Verrucomicrobiota bacterium]
MTNLLGSPINFKEDIFPILQDYCMDCHGPDKQKSGFRVDRRVHLLKGGDTGLPAVVPGDSEASYIIEVIKSSDPEIGMPPKGGKLFEDEVELLEQWIAAGANWPGQMDEKIEEGTDHWAFNSIKRPLVPGEAPNPIDAFIELSLQKEKIPPNKQAEPFDLIRRVSIILTGLPPQPSRVAEFLTEFEINEEMAYTRLVDELLASPHFGERWAQHWLDVIRWAETNGSESNLYRKLAWVYRDYVIRAFNQDIPYDEFIRQQLAGDGVGMGEALGFLVSGPHVPAATVGQEPSAIRQARADRMDEIIQTVGASMLGVTMSCARCHNHKFDPISIQDYYAMTAVFQDIEFGSRFPEFSKDNPRKSKANKIWKEVAKNRNKLRNQTSSWEEDWGGYKEVHWEPIEVTGLRLNFWSGYVGLDEVEIFGLPSENDNLARSSKGTTVRTDLAFAQQGDRFPVSRVIDGKYGTQRWQASYNKEKKQNPWIEFTFEKPVKVGRMRMSTNREYYFETDYLQQKNKFNFDKFLVNVKLPDGTWKEIASIQKIRDEMKQNIALAEAVQDINHLAYRLSEEGPRPSFVGSFIQPAVTHVFHRGSPENPRAVVMPGAPKILSGDLGVDNEASGRSRRAKFADWIVEERNPLTARVMANRIWQHIFGAGLVVTGGDFGRAGAPPSHPELLDWIAAEFARPSRPNGTPWSMKELIRLLVMSDAFKRSSRPTDIGLEKDATSSLLWRFPPRRVEAEVIRDGILLASGKLNREMGGRSYRIHNVKKTYAQWKVTDNFGPETWRRMIYQERMRRVDDQIFTAFDFPDCGQVRAKRPVSTTPLQALNLMNSNFVVDQSKHLAMRAEHESNGKLEKSVIRVFELIFSRKPKKEELDVSIEIARERGLEIVCRALINSNEFAFLP